jgi:hypothetical protein
MSIENENKKKEQNPTPGTRVREGLDDINSADGDSQENVISSTRSQIEDEKRGRKHGTPLTGSNPRAGD